ALRRAGQPNEAERPADPHRTAYNPGCKFGNAGELGSAAAQDYSRRWLGGKWGIREAVPHHFKNLLGALPNDVRDRGAGHDLRNIPLTVAGGRYRHQLARV